MALVGMRQADRRQGTAAKRTAAGGPTDFAALGEVMRRHGLTPAS